MPDLIAYVLGATVLLANASFVVVTLLFLGHLLMSLARLIWRKNL